MVNSPAHLKWNKICWVYSNTSVSPEMGVSFWFLQLAGAVMLLVERGPSARVKFLQQTLPNTERHSGTEAILVWILLLAAWMYSLWKRVHLCPPSKSHRVAQQQFCITGGWWKGKWKAFRSWFCSEDASVYTAIILVFKQTMKKAPTIKQVK